jgi:hypothetical protein
LQYYGVEAGAAPLLRNQEIPPGAWLLSSRLSYPVPFSTPGGERRTVVERNVVPTLPLRVIALNARSAFSTITFGARPFDITTAPADVLTAERIDPRAPPLWYLTMNAPEAAEQIVSGIYGLEAKRWRWTSGEAVVMLHRPERPAPLVVRLVVPDRAPTRRVRVAVDGITVLDQAVRGKGAQTLTSPSAISVRGIAARVVLKVDRTFSPPGDRRQLGLILYDIGFSNKQPGIAPGR